MRLITPAFVATLLMCSAASAQSLQTPGSKIVVLTCNPHVHTSREAHPWIDPYGIMHYSKTNFPYWDAFLGIDYENRASIAATEVDFGLVTGGELIAVVKDIGNFSPRVQIDHEFVLSREIFPLTGAPYCSVLRVRYSDGSVWSNASPPA